MSPRKPNLGPSKDTDKERETTKERIQKENEHLNQQTTAATTSTHYGDDSRFFVSSLREYGAYEGAAKI